MLLTTTPQQIIESFLYIMLAAAFMGIILVRMANRRGQIRTKLELRQVETEKTEEFFSSLLQEMKKLPVPSKERIETTKAIVNLLDKEVEKKLKVATQDMDKKYEKIVEEKNKTVRLAQEQYSLINQKFESVNKNVKKLGAEKRQAEAIVKSIAEGLIVVDKNGNVLLMNPAAEKLLGAKKEEKIGKSILSELKEEHLVSMAKDLSSGSDEKEIVLQSQSDQTRKILRTSNAVIESESGQTIGMVSILSDVTRQKELDEMKATFLASVSHELRTPLHSIQESLSLLLDKVGGELTEKQQKILSIAERNIDRLSRLINDLLDISKMEAGQYRLKPVAFQVEELVQQILATFDAWAKSKMIGLESKLPSESISIEADQDRLTQVLTNLAGNALKFTPSGGRVKIEVKKNPGPTASAPPFI